MSARNVCAASFRTTENIIASSANCGTLFYSPITACSRIHRSPGSFFHSVDREARIFQSTGRSRDQLPALPRLLAPSIGHTAQEGLEQRTHTTRGWQNLHRQALETAAPPSILVDQSYRVVHMSETVGRFLQPQGGPLSPDVTDLVRQEMRPELRAALHRAFERGESTLSAALFVQFNGAPKRMYIQVNPVQPRERDKGCERAIIFFIEGGQNEHVLAGEITGEQPVTESVRRLQQELEL